MVRPAAKELTQRELEVMHVFWTAGPATVAEIRDRLAVAGRNLAYTTVATLVRILTEKGFLEQINSERPFRYRPVRSFEEVSRSILGDLVERVFHGSRDQLLSAAVGRAPADGQGTGHAGGRLAGEKAMNAIGIALVWCIVQVTLISLLAAGVYLLVRRLRPAAAAPVVLAGLVMVVVLSLLVLSPWPRWTIHRAAANAGRIAAVRRGRAGQRRRGDDEGRGRSKTSPRAAAIAWQALVDELAKPQATAPTGAWHWPVVMAVLLLAAMACGLGWLMLGVAAVRWQRLRSRPVARYELAGVG